LFVVIDYIVNITKKGQNPKFFSDKTKTRLSGLDTFSKPTVYFGMKIQNVNATDKAQTKNLRTRLPLPLLDHITVKKA